MKKYTYTIYGTFEVEVKADSESEARANFDISDADVNVQGCYMVDDEEEE